MANKTSDVAESQENCTEKYGYYAPLVEKVTEARKAFLSWAGTLPPPANKLIQKMSRSNVDSPFPPALLGERDAFWFGELLGAPNEAQQTTAIGFISGYMYFLYQDHKMDGDKSVVSSGELAQNLLYARMIESFLAVVHNKNEFWPYLFMYLRQYTEGCEWERTKGTHITHYSEHDLLMVAARSAPVKAGVTALAIAAGKESELPKLCAAIDELVIALQIRDDIADCRQDLSMGRNTYVISRLLADMKPSLRDYIVGCLISFPAAMLAVEKALTRTNTLEALLDESTARLAAVSAKLALPPSSALQLYLNHLAAENRQIKARPLEAVRPVNEIQY